MTVRPDRFADFAVVARIDPKSGEPNKVPIPSGLEQYGWGHRDRGGRQHFNELFNLNGLWQHYFDERLNKLTSYTVGTLPSAATSGEGAMAYVSDEAGGAVLAVSDGTDWRRSTDRAIVSLI